MYVTIRSLIEKSSSMFAIDQSLTGQSFPGVHASKRYFR